MADQPEIVEDEQITEETTESPSLRDTLEAAIESEEETTTEEETPEEIPAETQAGAADSEAVEEPPEKPKAKPPVGWNPLLKEKFSELDPDVQEAVASREREMDQNFQQNAESRRIAESFVQTIEPYRALMAAEGVQDPLQAIDGLMRVTATLQTGSPQQKAERIAGLIQHYGVDIETLDGLLSGQVTQAEPQTPQDPRVDQIWNMMVQGQQQQQVQLQQQAGSDIQQFAAQHEFMDDPQFRNTMADFLDVARAHGHDMPLEDAYNRTMAALPQYAQVLSQRQAAQATKAAQDKVNAASSVTGQRGGASDVGGTDGSIRSIIQSQFDDIERV